VAEALRHVRERLARFFQRSGLVREAEGGRENHGWYWRSLTLMDGKARGALRAWCREDKGWRALAESLHRGEEGTEHSLFTEHADYFCSGFERGDDAGAVPTDLYETLAELALGSPAVCAARAIRRVAPGLALDAPALLSGAATAAEGFRSLFNSPDVRCMLESDDPARPYWREVLRYCIDGNLQAVLDEYAHVLKESLGLFDADDARVALELGQAMREALSLRTSSLDVDEFQRDESAGEFTLAPYKLRCRYALRFGDLKDDTAQVLQRAGAVRSAFNSPFRPFVLASTSIGQEGLDFHSYCHRVWHWNLPGNPVDMEQREGRVHRYKGHAVRKNVARRFGLATLRERWRGEGDPWDCLFQAARDSRPDGLSDLYPYWIFDDVEAPAKVERLVPLPPFSSEQARYGALKKALAVYRLAFGQPRQEDLVGYLVDLARSGTAVGQLDLSPPATWEALGT
jgi:hypothetical protein